MTTVYADRTPVTPVAEAVMAATTKAAMRSALQLDHTLSSTVVAAGSAVSITTNTPKDVCTLSLTAGTWDVSAVLVHNLTGVTATRYTGAISLTADTVPSAAGGDGLGTDAVVGCFATFGTTVTGAWTTVIPPTQIVLTETTTIHLVCADLFSAGTLTACGTLRARLIIKG